MIALVLHCLLTANAWAASLTQAATGSLVAAVWQGILLAMAVALGLRLLPKTPAAVRFAIWFGVFAVVVALPIAALLPRASGVAQLGGHRAWLALDSRWSLAIAAVWAIASLIRAVTFVIAGFRVRALWKRAMPINIGVLGDLYLQEATGSRRAQLCVSDEIDRPTVIGFFSPKILIPTWLMEKLTAVELGQIVAHESEHLGRADDWMNLLQKFALVVFPLNPALAWIERRLCFERELAVDERVLRTFAGRAGSAKAYASCLATLAEHRLEHRGLTPRLALVLGVLGRESELGRRVKRILERSEGMTPLHARLVLCGAMLGLLGSAIGLDHCPQVIGFTSGSEQDAVIAVSAEPHLHTSDHYRYEAAAFHPQPTSTAQEPVHRFVSSIQKPAKNNELTEKANVPHEILLKVEAGPVTSAHAAEHTASAQQDVDVSRAKQGHEQNAQPLTQVQWVVFSSFEGADGSRLVMTTASVPNDAVFPRPISDQPIDDQPQASPQIRSYAAVPVRGGWLVFQL